MSVRIRTHDPLRRALDNDPFVDVSARTVADAFSEVGKLYPRFLERLLDASGSVRPFINIYVNEEDIRFLQDQQTELRDGDEINIVPATAGG